NLGVGAAICFIEHLVLRFERELSALGHGVARVNRKVEQCRGELGGVDKGGPRILVQANLDLDVLAERGPEELLSIDDERVDIRFARLQRLLARKGKKASGELRPTTGGGGNQLGRLR